AHVEGLSGNYVLALHIDNCGGLWVGLDPGGLNRVQRQLFHPLDAASNLTIHSVCEDGQGGLWFSSTTRGIDYWKDGVLKNTDGPSPISRISQFDARALQVDRSDNIWAATFSGGLFRWSNNQFRPAQDADKIDRSINALYQDRSGRLWAGTERGLACWDGQAWRVFTTHEGLSANIVRAMADDPDCTIVVTVSGAMSVAKMGLVLCRMMEAGLAHLIVSTGAVLAHGLSEAIGCVHYKYDPRVSDQQLFQWGYNRVYDTLEMEANLWHAQELVSQVLEGLDWSQPLGSWQINREIGRRLVEQGQVPSILGTAFRLEVPVYVPAFTDSELGLDVAAHFLARRMAGDPGTVPEQDPEALFAADPPPLNPFLDLFDYTRRIHRAKRLGIFTIGGGVPRNWAQQVGP
ncbi:MAG: deoxyhypusine synthase family protein, partial [Candidatus Aminicenantales bacterium]